jgi:hypothetical protein
MLLVQPSSGQTVDAFWHCPHLYRVAIRTLYATRWLQPLEIHEPFIRGFVLLGMQLMQRERRFGFTAANRLSSFKVMA